jgi:hypothetical protein
MDSSKEGFKSIQVERAAVHLLKAPLGPCAR